MGKTDFKSKDSKELKNLLDERREQLRQLRFDLIADKLKNYRQVRHLKKETARILTILNSKK